MSFWNLYQIYTFDETVLMLHFKEACNNGTPYSIFQPCHRGKKMCNFMKNDTGTLVICDTINSIMVFSDLTCPPILKTIMMRILTWLWFDKAHSFCNSSFSSVSFTIIPYFATYTGSSCRKKAILINCYYDPLYIYLNLSYKGWLLVVRMAN